MTWLLPFVATLALAAPTAAQQAPAPRTAVLGDTIRVGDVVPVAVRLTIRPDERAVWPDTLPLSTPDLENAATVRERVDTLPDGRLQVTGIYAVTPWRTGQQALPELSVPIVAGDEAPRPVRVALPPFDVVSVLPPDTAGLEPRPTRGVVGPSWALWPFVLLGLLLLTVLGLGVWWMRRRRSAEPVATVPAATARDEALEALRAARQAGLIEREEWKELYVRVTNAVRGFTATLDPAWSEDLTTTELLARVRGAGAEEHARSLQRLLRPADHVKFARRVPGPAEAREELDLAEQWVRGAVWPPAMNAAREVA